MQWNVGLSVSISTFSHKARWPSVRYREERLDGPVERDSRGQIVDVGVASFTTSLITVLSYKV